MEPYGTGRKKAKAEPGIIHVIQQAAFSMSAEYCFKQPRIHDRVEGIISLVLSCIS